MTKRLTYRVIVILSQIFKNDSNYQMIEQLRKTYSLPVGTFLQYCILKRGFIDGACMYIVTV